MMWLLEVWKYKYSEGAKSNWYQLGHMSIILWYGVLNRYLPQSRSVDCRINLGLTKVQVSTF
jgi:hypothetical protein